MAKIRFPHPGEILEKEFLEPMGISAYKLAKAIDVPQYRASARFSPAIGRSPRIRACACRSSWA